MTHPILITLALVLGVLRVAGLFHVFNTLAPIWFQVFKDMAHLYVGGLSGAWGLGWWAVRLFRTGGYGPWAEVYHPINRLRLLCGWLAVALSVVETICAILSRI